MAAFPARLRGELVAGVDAVLLDAGIAGCSSTWLSSGEQLPVGCERRLRRSLEQVEAVLVGLDDPGEVACYRRLRATARAICPGTR